MAEEIKNYSDQENKETPDYGQIFFSWSFPEFHQHERSKQWYIWAGVAFVLLLIFAIFSKNFLFGVIVIISSLIIALFQRTNNEVKFKITEDGVLVNDKFYEYKKIKNFYIIYQPPEVKTLYFDLNGFIANRIPITLTDQDPVKIREVLLQYLAEDLEREEEPTSDQFSRFFKL